MENISEKRKKYCIFAQLKHKDYEKEVPFVSIYIIHLRNADEGTRL
jgi:hypothetical protein